MTDWLNHHKKREFLESQSRRVIEELEIHHPDSKLAVHAIMSKWIRCQNSRGQERDDAGKGFVYLVRHFGCGFTIDDKAKRVTVYGKTQYASRKNEERIIVQCDDLATACERALVLAWDAWGRWPAFCRQMHRIEKQKKAKKRGRKKRG